MSEGVKFTLCDQDSTLPFYRVYSDSQGTELIGYIIQTAGKGYSSSIETITALDTAFNIVGIKITSQQETPGLGSKCMEIKYKEKDPWFQRQYRKYYREKQREKPLNALTVAVDKDGGAVHSITGATITSRAITNSIKEKTIALKKLLEKQP
jgi:electron transport complex protein RnfG